MAKWLSEVDEMQIIAHQKAATAIIDGALQHHNDKIVLARKLKMTPVFISMIFTDHPMPLHERWRRWPRSRIRDLVSELTLPSDVATDLVEHLTEVADLTEHKRTDRRKASGTYTAADARSHLQYQHEEANAAINRGDQGLSHHQLFREGQEVFEGVPLLEDARQSAHLCLFLSHAATRSAKPTAAVFYADLCREVTNYIPKRTSEDREERVVLNLNASHVKVNALHHLKAYREAARLHEETDAQLQRPSLDTFTSDGLRSRFLRDRVSTLARLNKTSLRSLQHWADVVREIQDQQGNDLPPYDVLLIDRSLASSYIQRNRLRPAFTTLRPYIESSNRVPDPIVHIMLWRTVAQYWWERADKMPSPEWEAAIRDAYTTAQRTGFPGQILGMWSNFGQAMDSIASEPSPA